MTYQTRSPLIDPEHEISDVSFAQNAPQESSDSSSHVFENLRVLWMHRRLLFRAAIAGFLISMVAAFVIPPRYRSTAHLMPPDNESASSGLAMVAASMSDKAGALADTAGEFLGLKKNSDIFVGILGSRTVQDNLIQRFNLQKVYWDRHMEDARKDLEDHTKISVDRKSQIIEITVTDHSPTRAAAMTQAYVDELNVLVAQLSTSSARRERIFLEGRLKEVNTGLEAAEKEFSEFASKNTAIDIKEQGKAMMDAAATLQGELIAAQSELEGLRQIYNDSNVRIRSTKARIAELQLQLRKLGGKDESGNAGLVQADDSLYPSIRKLPMLGVPYADLYRRTKVQEAVFETLTRQYEMAKVQEAKEIPTVKVLDAPDIPDKRSFPPRLLMISLGIVLAVCLAAFWVLGIRKWKGIDAQQPGKQLASEIWIQMTAQIPWIANGVSRGHTDSENGLRAASSKIEREH